MPSRPPNGTASASTSSGTPTSAIGSPAIRGSPRNLTSATDVNNQAWWVVDEWVDGETVAERLDTGELAATRRRSSPSSPGAHCLHEHGIVPPRPLA